MPIIDANGIVLSGNDRTMAGQLSAEKGTDEAYLETLQENAQMYGFTAEEVKGMQHPRLVFELAEAMPYTTQTFAKFNASDKKAQNNTEKAIKVGKTIDKETVSKIAGVIDKFDSVSECLNSKEGTNEIINYLTQAGILQRNDVEQYEQNGVFNASGKEFIQTVLLGVILDEENLRRIDTMPSLRDAILSALNGIVQNTRLNEGYTLKEEINEAIEVVYSARREMKLKAGDSLKDYYTQIDIFSQEDNIKSATVQMLADRLNSTKETELREVLKRYNEQALQAQSGQMNLLLQKVETKEELLTRILKEKGYDTETINRQGTIISDSDNGAGRKEGEPEPNRRGSKTEGAREKDLN